MTNQKDNVRKIQIAYIGGGSRGWAWTFMTDLALEKDMGGCIRLYDLDSEAAEVNASIGNRISERDDAVGKWEYKVYDSLAGALGGADFIVISILPGTFAEMEVDVHLPERLSIYQSVGDTTGFGGMIRALRTIPMYVEIGEAVKKYAPGAWVINYTNPMSLCVKTLYHVFPEVKAFGCCHEVFGTQKILQEMVQQMLGMTAVKRRDIQVNVLGINHFTWFDAAAYKGLDLFPLYREFAEKFFEEGYEEADTNWANQCFACRHRVKFDLFQKYGLIAAAGDRHLAEFMGGGSYLKSPATVKEWKFGLTSVAWRKENLRERIEKGKRLSAGQESVELTPTGEEGIQLIKALAGLTRRISNVNLPNTDRQISNLPASSIVETNAVFAYNSVRPVIAGRITEPVKAFIMPHIQNYEDIFAAALTCNRELVVKAFLNDPMLSGKDCTEREIRDLANEMIDRTMRYLPKGWQNGGRQSIRYPKD